MYYRVRLAKALCRCVHSDLLHHAYICVYMYTHARTRARAYTRTQFMPLDKRCSRFLDYVCTHMYIRMHTNTYVCIHIYRVCVCRKDTGGDHQSVSSSLFVQLGFFHCLSNKDIYKLYHMIYTSCQMCESYNIQAI